MVHSNPLLQGQSGQKFITFGEIMLRLTPPNYGKIRVANSFEASYGGSEANIALALANLGVDSTFFSVVPNNSLGKSAVRMLRANDVHCTPVILLEGFNWLHLSGITPALSPSCARFILDCLVKAREKGLTVSFDGNFRSKLWTWEQARDYCTQCLPYVDVLLGIEPYHLWRDEEDHGQGDWKDGVPLQPSYEQQDEVFQRFVNRYPNLKCIARHVRYAHSGSENSLMAYMWYQGHTFESKRFTFHILDRVGGGDAFASGLIYAMMNRYKPMDMVNFAVACSVIKHTIHGDGNITDDVQSIRDLMDMSYDIKR